MTYLALKHHEIDHPQVCEKHLTDDQGNYLELEYEPADAVQTDRGWQLIPSGYVCPYCEMEEMAERMPWLAQEAGWSDVA